MKLTADEWAELWFRQQVGLGMHPSLAMTMLEQFRAWLAGPPCARELLPRFVCRTDRYVVVELLTSVEGTTTRAIFCRRCSSLSFNANDVHHLFCSHCNQFHS